MENFLSDICALSSNGSNGTEESERRPSVSAESTSSVSSCDESLAFVRPHIVLDPDEPNRIRWLMDSTFKQVPNTFQRAWEDLIDERKGNIGVLDGYVFAMDVLMWEEGFHKIKVADSEDDARFVRRSFYTHLSHPRPTDSWSCLLVFTAPSVVNGQAKSVMMQSMVAERFKRSQDTVDSSGKLRSPEFPLPWHEIRIAARHWISNAYSGSLRMSVVEMYRDLHVLAMELKDRVVLPLKAIIAHGLDPPLLVGLEALPMEVIEKLALTLPTSEAIRLGRTCKRILSIIDRERLWKTYLLRDFKGFQSFTEDEIQRAHGSWKQCYESERKRRNSAKAEQMRRYAGYTRLEPFYSLPPMLQYMYPFPHPPGFDEDDLF